MTRAWILATPNTRDYYDDEESAVQARTLMTPEQRRTAVIYPCVVEPEVRWPWERGEGVA